MSYFGKLPYHQRLEHVEHQSWYHNLNICGSSFHGLATTLEEYAKRDDLGLGLKQIDNCINARLDEMRKRQNPDPAHNSAINVLRDLKRKYLSINENHYYYASSLPTTIIRYDDKSNQFIININGKIIRGGKRRFKKITKKRKKLTRKTRKIRR